ncbi:MAG: sigma-54 dependent transcriptional regulator, partial [Steroidobacteraceae bacterium]
MSGALLVVEDEPTLAKNIAGFLSGCGYEVHTTGTAEEALSALESYKPDFILLDFNLPGMNGLKAISKFLATDSRVKIVMMTGHASVELAVDAMKAGAYDFLTKPVSLSKLRLQLDKIAAEERQRKALAYYMSRDARTSGLDKLIGECESMQHLRAAVRKVIAGDETLRDGNPPAVLITGGTGTGKELVARALHFEGPRRDAPFVAINCASIPAPLLESELFGYERGAFTDAKSRKLGLVETADRGTLFLDEIGDMDLALQVKLLRLLEDRSIRPLGGLRDQAVNVRIVAATHRDLESLVREGRFRTDLLFRIRMVHLAVPPLRTRGDDVLLLAEHYLALHAQRYRRDGLRLSPGARRALIGHHWPGNVRELRNVMEQAVLMSSGMIVEAADLEWLPTGSPASGGPPGEAAADGMSLEQIERNALLRALETSQWNVTQAARLLGVSRD